MISLVDIGKSYARSGVKAVDGLSIEVRDGEIFGFLGPNGAGKTTTLKILSGVIRADSGSACIDGVDVAKDPLEAKRRIGYVADDPEIFSKLRAWEFLNFVGDVHGVPGPERRARAIDYATRFEIADALDAPIGAWSRGMKQKLLITASLLHEPANWILDEPMVGLDPVAAFRLKELMRERANAGKAVFFSTHVMEVAERVCDRLAIISKGRVLFMGSMDELRGKRGADESLERLFLDLVDGEGGATSEALPKGSGGGAA